MLETGGNSIRGFPGDKVQGLVAIKSVSQCKYILRVFANTTSATTLSLGTSKSSSLSLSSWTALEQQSHSSTLMCSTSSSCSLSSSSDGSMLQPGRNVSTKLLHYGCDSLYSASTADKLLPSSILLAWKWMQEAESFSRHWFISDICFRALKQLDHLQGLWQLS